MNFNEGKVNELMNEFIKKELLIQSDSLSMSELRESVLDYLSRSDEGYSKNN